MRITKLEAVVIARALFAAVDEEADFEQERALLALACAISDYSIDARAGRWSPNIPDGDMKPKERARRLYARHGDALRKRAKKGDYTHYLAID